jgi:DNA uptake protein ComE-like DNA-binding protein
MPKMRINLANPQELLELPGLLLAGRDNLVRHRAEHGPIRDAEELARVIWPLTITPALLERVDFHPAAPTAAKAPGA